MRRRFHFNKRLRERVKAMRPADGGNARDSDGLTDGCRLLFITTTPGAVTAAGMGEGTHPVHPARRVGLVARVLLCFSASRPTAGLL